MHWRTQPYPCGVDAASYLYCPSAVVELCSAFEGLLRGLWHSLCSLPRLRLRMALQRACLAGVSALGAMAHADRSSFVHILFGWFHDACGRGSQCAFQLDAAEVTVSWTVLDIKGPQEPDNAWMREGQLTGQTRYRT